MSHLSEKENSLLKRQINNLEGVKEFNKSVIFISLPYLSNDYSFSSEKKLIHLINNLSEDSVILILGSFVYTSVLLTKIDDNIKLKLSIGIKTDNIPSIEGQLKNNTSSLIVLKKDKDPLKHTKTRIGYTFCPYCDRTTKDYGGKKHLYHEFGTLMSDVWRDFIFDYNGSLNYLSNRLIDLFSLSIYNDFIELDLRKKLTEATVRTKIIYSDQINTIERSSLYNDDCISRLKKIPDNSIDFCFADPPYNVDKKYLSWNDNLDIQNYFNWCDEWLNELARVVKPGCTVAILNLPQWVIRHFKFLIEKLDYQDWIIWDAMGLPVRQIMPSHYSILCFSKGKPRKLPGLLQKPASQNILTYKPDYCIRASCIKKREKNNILDKEIVSNIWWDVHRLKHNNRRVDHPTQLPPLFMKRLISLFTNKNEIVLDPFNGSGTTSLCSELLDRKYIGIEISEYYYKISKDRHNEIQDNVDPFRKRDSIPKTKNNNVKRIKVQKYKVDKKSLQLEVKEIAKIVGRVPTKDDVKKHSKHKFEYFESYFSNWSDVTAAARTTGMKDVELKSDYIKKIKK
ncbi:DNA methyltransferase [Flammeovirga agarivorans]|uniref:Site-specific DNA-methyltransferase n=1 Tax=Flammeovirga agarivorans TaxID=2726742 RepID=A0A7X8XZA2_9BACT|nr:DNA methyltransferase [Flammeovirga agarivorans]NLR94981.1 site-specific DNA-methyltransferase [Flammeovirga agarivorans]